MEFFYIPEPLLEFADNSHICPRLGISNYRTYDANNEPRRDDIFLGVVGISENIELLRNWLLKVSKSINAKESNQPNLFPAFIGFNKNAGY